MEQNKDIIVDPSTLHRLSYLRSLDRYGPETKLRVTVEGGGCSGFQYSIDLSSDIEEDDIIFENAVITDEISLNFLKGSRILYKESLLESKFEIDNPNAQSSCGCGTSFSV